MKRGSASHRASVVGPSNRRLRAALPYPANYTHAPLHRIGQELPRDRAAPDSRLSTRSLQCVLGPTRRSPKEEYLPGRVDLRRRREKVDLDILLSNPTLKSAAGTVGKPSHLLRIRPSPLRNARRRKSTLASLSSGATLEEVSSRLTGYFFRIILVRMAKRAQKRGRPRGPKRSRPGR